MFEGRLPAQPADRAPRRSSRRRAARRSGSSTAQQLHAGRHERRRRPPPRDGEARAVPLRPDAPRLLRHRGPRPRHGHQRRVGLGQLPVADHRVLRPGVLHAPTASSAWRACGRGTTGCSRSGTPPYPERIIPLGITYLADPALAVAEIERNAARGFTSVTFPERPHAIGLPSLWDREHWDPIIDACVETDTVISLHVGSSGHAASPPGSPVAAARRHAVRPALAGACAEWLWSGYPLEPPDAEDRHERRRHRLGADAARPARQHRRPLRLRPRVGRAPGRRAAAQLLVLHDRRPVDDRRRATASASRTSWSRSTTRTATAPGPTRRTSSRRRGATSRPPSCGRCAARTRPRSTATRCPTSCCPRSRWDDRCLHPHAEKLAPRPHAREELVLLARRLWREGYDDHLAGHITVQPRRRHVAVQPVAADVGRVRARTR